MWTGLDCFFCSMCILLRKFIFSTELGVTSSDVDISSMDDYIWWDSYLPKWAKSVVLSYSNFDRSTPINIRHTIFRAPYSVLIRSNISTSSSSTPTILTQCGHSAGRKRWSCLFCLISVLRLSVKKQLCLKAEQFGAFLPPESLPKCFWNKYDFTITCY